MSTWVIISWIGVAVLTFINIVIFLQLKKASTQMMQAMFPGAKDMNDAVSQMQNMMKSAQRGRPHPMMGGRMVSKKARAKAQSQDAQLQQAMQLLQNMQGPKKK